MKSLMWIPLLFAAPLAAQPLPHIEGADAVYVIQPGEKDTVGCQYSGRAITLGNVGTATVALRKKRVADATPSGLISNGPTANGGENVDIVIEPDNGVSAGARAGNEYQITLLPTDADGNQPKCELYVIVKTKYLRRAD